MARQMLFGGPPIDGAPFFKVAQTVEVNGDQQRVPMNARDARWEAKRNRTQVNGVSNNSSMPAAASHDLPIPIAPVGGSLSDALRARPVVNQASDLFATEYGRNEGGGIQFAVDNHDAGVSQSQSKTLPPQAVLSAPVHGVDRQSTVARPPLPGIQLQPNWDPHAAFMQQFAVPQNTEAPAAAVAGRRGREAFHDRGEAGAMALHRVLPSHSGLGSNSASEAQQQAYGSQQTAAAYPTVPVWPSPDSVQNGRRGRLPSRDEVTAGGGAAAASLPSEASTQTKAATKAEAAAIYAAELADAVALRKAVEERTRAMERAEAQAAQTVLPMPMQARTTGNVHALARPLDVQPGPAAYASHSSLHVPDRSDRVDALATANAGAGSSVLPQPLPPRARSVHQQAYADELERQMNEKAAFESHRRGQERAMAQRAAGIADLIVATDNRGRGAASVPAGRQAHVPAPLSTASFDGVGGSMGNDDRRRTSLGAAGALAVMGGVGPMHRSGGPSVGSGGKAQRDTASTAAYKEALEGQIREKEDARVRAKMQDMSPNPLPVGGLDSRGVVGVRPHTKAAVMAAVAASAAASGYGWAQGQDVIPTDRPYASYAPSVDAPGLQQVVYGRRGSLSQFAAPSGAALPPTLTVEDAAAAKRARIAQYAAELENQALSDKARKEAAKRRVAADDARLDREAIVYAQVQASRKVLGGAGDPTRDENGRVVANRGAAAVITHQAALAGSVSPHRMFQEGGGGGFGGAEEKFSRGLWGPPTGMGPGGSVLDDRDEAGPFDSASVMYGGGERPPLQGYRVGSRPGATDLRAAMSPDQLMRKAHLQAEAARDLTAQIVERERRKEEATAARKAQEVAEEVRIVRERAAMASRFEEEERMRKEKEENERRSALDVQIQAKAREKDALEALEKEKDAKAEARFKRQQEEIAEEYAAEQRGDLPKHRRASKGGLGAGAGDGPGPGPGEGREGLFGPSRALPSPPAFPGGPGSLADQLRGAPPFGPSDVGSLLGQVVPLSGPGQGASGASPVGFPATLAQGSAGMALHQYGMPGMGMAPFGMMPMGVGPMATPYGVVMGSMPMGMPMAMGYGPTAQGAAVAAPPAAGPRDRLAAAEAELTALRSAMTSLVNAQSDAAFLNGLERLALPLPPRVQGSSTIESVRMLPAPAALAAAHALDSSLHGSSSLLPSAYGYTGGGGLGAVGQGVTATLGTDQFGLGPDLERALNVASEGVQGGRSRAARTSTGQVGGKAANVQTANPLSLFPELQALTVGPRPALPLSLPAAQYSTVFDVATPTPMSGVRGAVALSRDTGEARVSRGSSASARSLPGSSSTLLEVTGQPELWRGAVAMQYALEAVMEGEEGAGAGHDSHSLASSTDGNDTLGFMPMPPLRDAQAWPGEVGPEPTVGQDGEGDSMLAPSFLDLDSALRVGQSQRAGMHTPQDRALSQSRPQDESPTAAVLRAIDSLLSGPVGASSCVGIAQLPGLAAMTGPAQYPASPPAPPLQVTGQQLPPAQPTQATSRLGVPHSPASSELDYKALIADNTRRLQQLSGSNHATHGDAKPGQGFMSPGVHPQGDAHPSVSVVGPSPTPTELHPSQQYLRSLKAKKVRPGSSASHSLARAVSRETGVEVGRGRARVEPRREPPARVPSPVNETDYSHVEHEYENEYRYEGQGQGRGKAGREREGYGTPRDGPYEEHELPYPSPEWRRRDESVSPARPVRTGRHPAWSQGSEKGARDRHQHAPTTRSRSENRQRPRLHELDMYAEEGRYGSAQRYERERGGGRGWRQPRYGQGCRDSDEEDERRYERGRTGSEPAGRRTRADRDDTPRYPDHVRVGHSPAESRYGGAYGNGSRRGGTHRSPLHPLDPQTHSDRSPRGAGRRGRERDRDSDGVRARSGRPDWSPRGDSRSPSPHPPRGRRRREGHARW